MIALMNDLQVIVNDASTNDTLYPSDLILSTDIMFRISQTVNGLRSIHRQIDVLAQVSARSGKSYFRFGVEAYSITVLRYGLSLFLDIWRFH